MRELESRDYSWRYITSSSMITDQPCELVCVDMCPSAGAAQITIYNGIDASGNVIQNIYAAVQLNMPFNPPKPIYCSKGIYIDHTANITSTLVQFRLVTLKKGEE